jgi:flagellar protein FlaF
MGMDTVIVSVVSIALIIVVAYSFAMETNNLITSAHSGFSNLQKLTLKKIKTNIEIQNILWNVSGNDYLRFSVANTGDTKLSNFELWDVVVVRNNSTLYLSYGSDWIVDSISNDSINPNILDPFESAQIEVRIPFESGESVIIRVSTPNGVVATQRYNVG